MRVSSEQKGGGRPLAPLALMVLLLWPLFSILSSSQADANPTARYVESFATYEHADGARTTAWWNREQGQLTLRPPDAGNLRRQPVLASRQEGGLLAVWVEDRGEGATLWMQQVDGHGNRLLNEDLALFPWAGVRWETVQNQRLLSLAAITDDEWLLVWSDDNGVWAFRKWQGAQAQDGLLTRLAESSNVPVQTRCWQAHCAVIWQDGISSQVRIFDENMTLLSSTQLSGQALASWTDEGDVWLAWQDAGQFVAQRFDKTLTPRGPNPVGYVSDGDLEDIAAYGEGLLLLGLNPTHLIQMTTDIPATELAAYAPAQRGRLLVDDAEVAVVLQTSADAALWLERYAPLSSSRLLRLGLTGAEPWLGEAVFSSEGMVAIAWSEGNQVFVRKWQPSGWSPWRHEVAPAYAATSGWVAQEGLGHSLEVNPPGTSVRAVTLEADMQLAGGSVQFFVSNQGAKYWQAITPGTEVVFTVPGTRLRWYARLRRSAWGTAPQINEVLLNYQYQYVDYWPEVNVEW